MLSAVARQWTPSAKLAAILSLLIFGTKADLIAAQIASPEAQKLTLPDAIDLALKQNLDIQVADIEVAVQRQDHCRR